MKNVKCRFKYMILVIDSSKEDFFCNEWCVKSCGKWLVKNVFYGELEYVYCCFDFIVLVYEGGCVKIGYVYGKVWGKIGCVCVEIFGVEDGGYYEEDFNMGV